MINYEVVRKSDMFLVFLHGLGGDLNLWDREKRFFQKKGYSTLAIDLRAHGLSQRPENIEQYPLERFAHDLNEVLIKEKINNCVLIGHCFGGAVLITYQEIFPKIGKAYILIDTTDKSIKKMKMFKKTSPLSKLINLTLRPFGVRKNGLYHVDYHKHIGTGDWNVRRIFNDMRSVSFKAYMFTFQNFAEYDKADVLKKFKKPTLIIHGEEDSVFDMTVAKRMNSEIKNSKLKAISKANHQVVLNNSDELKILIDEFLNEQKLKP